MTDFIDERDSDIIKYTERAVHFFEKEDYKQALQDFEKAFFYTAESFIYNEKMRKVGSTSANYFKNEESEFLFTLGQSIEFIIKCYTCLKEFEHAKYFIQVLEDIVDNLSERKEFLEVNQLNALDSFSNNLKKFEKFISINEQNSEIIESNDTVFSDLSKTLNKFLSLEICSISNTNSDSSCFIATAAYDTSIHADLDTFRQFRDTKLLPSFLGKKFVFFYYIVGPKLAIFVNKNSLLKKDIRKKLESLAKLMRKYEVTNR